MILFDVNYIWFTVVRIILLVCSVNCELVGSFELLTAREGIGTLSCLAPDATEGTKPCAGMIPGLNGITPRDVKPRVAMPVVVDLDQDTAKIHPTFYLVIFLPGLFFI